VLKVLRVYICAEVGQALGVVDVRVRHIGPRVSGAVVELLVEEAAVPFVVPKIVPLGIRVAETPSHAYIVRL